MKEQIEQLIKTALESLAAGSLPELQVPDTVHLERTRNPEHGDFATNMAMALAKKVGRNPRELAQLIVDAIPQDAAIEKLEIAGPGFINIYVASSNTLSVIADVLEQGERYGASNPGNKQKVHIEFVSANPTGPLHVGHGRGAAYGDAVARLLAATGHDVTREYYVNDAGRQMDILATSVWLRYLAICGEDFTYPSAAYQGTYITETAQTIHADRGDALLRPATEVFGTVSADEPEGGNKDEHIDGLIEAAKSILAADYDFVQKTILDAQLDDIRDDLGNFRVSYDQWFSEASLVDSGAVEHALNTLKASGHTFEQDGALWFASSKLGDDKDRVLVRSNGSHTYFASDIAYHLNKLERGYDRLIDIWGADHHGYVPRVRAAVSALGANERALDVRLVQFAILYRNGERASMSTRSGEYVTLRELYGEVGIDAARYFYVMRASEQHLDFDLDLAKRQSNDNPVYYIQYAHARICRVYEQLAERELQFNRDNGLNNLQLLSEPHEQALLPLLAKYPEVISSAAKNCAPHTLAHYLRELADAFHSYYNAHVFLVDDAALRDARLALIGSIRQVIANGLNLLGVSAPEHM